MCLDDKICSDGSIIICNNSSGTTTIGVDSYAVANSPFIADKINETIVKSEYRIRDRFEDLSNNFEDLSYKVKLIEEEYENQLQRQKVHISRGDGIKGNRIHCRRRKITIPKRSS